MVSSTTIKRIAESVDRLEAAIAPQEAEAIKVYIVDPKAGTRTLLRECEPQRWHPSYGPKIDAIEWVVR